MAEVLLINPKKRRRTAKRASPAQVKARAKFAAAARSRSRKRRSNPIAAVKRRVHRRRSNPMSVVRRRRRNPIGMGSAKMSVKSITAMLKDAAIGGAGAVGMDVLMGKINPHLPVSMQVSPTGIGVGDAVKAALTVLIGKVLKKPTRGLSEKAALGALTTQARDLISGLLPATVTGSLAYWNPAGVIQGNQRVGPIRNGSKSLAAYQRPGGGTPMLNAYNRPGAPSQLLSGMTARQREGAIR